MNKPPRRAYARQKQTGAGKPPAPGEFIEVWKPAVAERENLSAKARLANVAIRMHEFLDNETLDKA